jgi:hypothetical protein
MILDVPHSIVEKLADIKRYTPAEILFLMEMGNPNIKYLTKLILLNLMFQKVLEAIEYQYADGPYNPNMAHVYITAGQQFFNHTQLPYESNFLSPFKKNTKEHWWCKPYLADCINKINNKTNLAYISQSIQRQSGFKIILKWGTLQNKTTLLTKQAIELSNSIKIDLALIGKVLYYLIDNDKLAAQKLIDELGAFALFIPGYQIDYLPTTYQTLMLEIQRLP